MQQGVKDLLTRRMNRKVLATILGMKEREVDPYLTPELQRRLKKVILDELNDFLTLVLEVVDTVDDESSMVNDYFLELLEQIHAATCPKEEVASG